MCEQYKKSKDCNLQNQRKCRRCRRGGWRPENRALECREELHKRLRWIKTVWEKKNRTLSRVSQRRCSQFIKAGKRCQVVGLLHSEREPESIEITKVCFCWQKHRVVLWLHRRLLPIWSKMNQTLPNKIKLGTTTTIHRCCFLASIVSVTFTTLCFHIFHPLPGFLVHRPSFGSVGFIYHLLTW